MTLASLPLKCAGRIERYTEFGTTEQRLCELGFVEGALVEKIGVAPLGDPFLYRIGQAYISIRERDADKIEVTLCNTH